MSLSENGREKKDKERESSLLRVTCRLLPYPTDGAREAPATYEREPGPTSGRRAGGET